MAMRQFFNEVKSMRVKDLPDYFKPMLSKDYLGNKVTKALDDYNAKYIQTSSAAPLNHLIFGGLIFSYLVALPEERRHLEHERHKREHGEHAAAH